MRLILETWRVYLWKESSLIHGHHDHGLPHVRLQALNWTNTDLLSVQLIGTNTSEVWIIIQILATKFQEKALAKCQSFCSGPTLIICKLQTILKRSRQLFLKNVVWVTYCCFEIIPDNKVHGANMGPIWGRQDPDGPHVGRMNFAIWDYYPKDILIHV